MRKEVDEVFEESKTYDNQAYADPSCSTQIQSSPTTQPIQAGALDEPENKTRSSAPPYGLAPPNNMGVLLMYF